MKEIDNYINTLESDGTKKSYKHYIEQFCNYNEINDFNGFKKIDIDDVFNYKNYLVSERNNSINSLKPKFTALSKFYSYLVNNDKYDIDINIIEKSGVRKNIKKGKPNPANKTYLTQTEKNMFLNECKNERETAMCAIFLNTGIRVSELINLKLSEYVRYKDENNKLSSYIYCVRKGGKIQQIEFNEYVTEQIEKYLKVRKESEYDNLFISNCGNPMSIQSIDRTLNKLAKRAGIDKSISAHSLRRTLATDLNKRGVALNTIKFTLGHENISTTGLYIQDMNTKEDYKDLMMHYIVKGE